MHLLATDEGGHSIHGWQFQSGGQASRLLKRLVMRLARTIVGEDTRLGHVTFEVVVQKRTRETLYHTSYPTHDT